MCDNNVHYTLYKKTSNLPSQEMTYLQITDCLNKRIKWSGKRDMKRRHGGTVIIGCISHICWEQACGEATCSVKCNLQWPGPCDSQHSEWFGWGQWGLTQSNEFHYGRQGIQITHIQHKHRGRASDRVGAQHERQINGDIERKLDVGRGLWGNWLEGVKG